MEGDRARQPESGKKSEHTRVSAEVASGFATAHGAGILRSGALCALARRVTGTGHAVAVPLGRDAILALLVAISRQIVESVELCAVAVCFCALRFAQDLGTRTRTSDRLLRGALRAQGE